MGRSTVNTAIYRQRVRVRNWLNRYNHRVILWLIGAAFGLTAAVGVFATLAAIFAVIAVVQTVKLNQRHFDMDWGDVPTWLASFGTVTALFVALWALRNEVAQRRADEVNRIDKENKRQAELISVWIDGPLRSEESPFGGPDYGYGVMLGLVNASPGVVYHLQIDVEWIRLPHWQDPEPDPLQQSPHTLGYVATLPPGTYRVPFPMNPDIPNPDQLTPESVRIWFIDERSQHWGREDYHLNLNADPSFLIPSSRVHDWFRVVSGVRVQVLHAEPRAKA
ncbi:hypothetical protein [Mycobacteroides abscessus]